MWILMQFLIIIYCIYCLLVVHHTWQLPTAYPILRKGHADIVRWAESFKFSKSTQSNYDVTNTSTLTDMQRYRLRRPWNHHSLLQSTYTARQKLHSFIFAISLWNCIGLLFRQYMLIRTHRNEVGLDTRSKPIWSMTICCTRDATSAYPRPSLINTFLHDSIRILWIHTIEVGTGGRPPMW